MENSINTEIKSYNKSFEARLCLAKEEIKDYYLEILSNILMHEKVRHRIAWHQDSYYHGRDLIARVNVRSNTLYLYLALNPSDYADSKYKLYDVSDKKKYVKTPLLIKIKGGRTFKYAFTLLNDLYDKFSLVDTVDTIDTDELIHRYINRPLDILLSEGLVKEVIRKSRVAVTRNLNTDLVSIKFYVKKMNPNYEINSLYLVGNIKELGGWDLKKALKMEFVNDHFELNVLLPKEHLEFKILEKKDWNFVEKGMWCEEIINHHYDLANDREIEDLIFNFNHRR